MCCCPCFYAASGTRTRRFRYSILGARGCGCSCLSGRGAARGAACLGSCCAVPGKRRCAYREPAAFAAALISSRSYLLFVRKLADEVPQLLPQSLEMRQRLFVRQTPADLLDF